MNWIQNTLDSVNAEFKEKQQRREKSLKENGSLDDFRGWWITHREYEKIYTLAIATERYGDLRGVPGKVIKFARRLKQDKKARKFKVINVHVDEIMSYIEHSSYWETNSEMIQNTKIVFAENSSMECVICYFKNKFIITTQSSFENIKREISIQLKNGTYEGKLQHASPKMRHNRYEIDSDDFRMPYTRNNLDMDKFTF